MRVDRDTEQENDWRSNAAAILEEVLAEENKGRMPTTPGELIDMLERRGFIIVPMDPGILSAAVSLLDRRLILIPERSDEQMTCDLVHEAGEIYLRSDVRAEYYHPLSQQDEFHNVAAIATKRVRRASRYNARVH
jgi:hypothetical protein